MNMKAIAQSHLVASSVGINEGGYRVLAVGVGCFFVGLAGAAYAHYNLVVSPTSFDLTATLWLVMYVLIGGISSFAGPIVGTAILVAHPGVLPRPEDVFPLHLLRHALDRGLSDARRPGQPARHHEIAMGSEEVRTGPLCGKGVKAPRAAPSFP